MALLYIAGPMTGIPDHNIPEFNRVEKALLDAGHVVLNPARHEREDRTWKDYMKLGLRDVLAADGIALLPGWQLSQGAQLEVKVGRAIGLDVRDWEAWVLF